MDKMGLSEFPWAITYEILCTSWTVWGNSSSDELDENDYTLLLL